MISHTRTWIAGAAGMLLGIALMAGSTTRAADDKKEMIEGIKKIAAALEKKDDAGAKKLAQELAKKVDDIEDVMHLFGYRTRPDGKPGPGVGFGPKADKTKPDGIEKRLTEVGKTAPSPKELADEADALKEAGYIAAAIGEVALVKGPPMDDAKKKALAKAKGKDWNAWAAELVKDGEALAQAAKDKNAAGVQKAAAKFDRAKVTSSCNKCHDVFQ